jgi:RNA polymerase sigma-70 factor (ECF subfamily)
MMESIQTAVESDEAIWIESCRKGHRRAFEPLVRRYASRAYGFALSMVRDPEEAKDLSQEAFLRVFRNLHRFDKSKPFYPWFLTILRNLCLSHLRRRRPTVALEDVPPAMQAAARTGLSPELHIGLKRALSALSEADREIVILKDFQDLTYEDISRILNIPRGTVQSRLYYARRRLRDRLNGVLPQRDARQKPSKEGQHEV